MTGEASHVPTAHSSLLAHSRRLWLSHPAPTLGVDSSRSVLLPRSSQLTPPLSCSGRVLYGEFMRRVLAMANAQASTQAPGSSGLATSALAREVNSTTPRMPLPPPPPLFLLPPPRMASPSAPIGVTHAAARARWRACLPGCQGAKSATSRRYSASWGSGRQRGRWQAWGEGARGARGDRC